MRKSLLLLATFCCTLMVHAVEGGLVKKFTVDDGKQVIFSQGNLQYQASTGTWRFAENQYDTIGAGNANIAADYNGWIDLFGWGTGNAPTQTSTDAANYANFTDWGVNAISNGGNQTNFWRTLTKEEWDYLLRLRPNANNLVGAGTVAGVPGLIILPDNWTEGYWTTLNSFEDLGITVSSVGYSCDEDTIFLQNIYDADHWTQMEYEGALFLPAAGHRDGTQVDAVGEFGAYACSTPNTENGENSFMLLLGNNSVYTDYPSIRHEGYSVRLVKDAENVIDTIRVTFEAPKAGDATPYSGTMNDPNVYGSAAIPVGVHYELKGCAFYNKKGNGYSEEIFIQNTTYKVQFIIEPEEGYYFPTSKEGYPDTYKVVCIVNNDTLKSDVNGWKMSGFYFQAEKGYSVESASFLLTLSSACGIIGTVGSGLVSDKLFKGDRTMMAFITSAMNLFALAAFLFVPAGYYWLDCIIVVLFGLSIGVLICFLGGLMAVDIAPAEAAGATAGVIGMASYAAAGLQDILSGYLIEGRKVIVDGVAQYDFSAIRIFWLAAAAASLALLVYIFFHARLHPQQVNE